MYGEKNTIVICKDGSAINWDIYISRKHAYQYAIKKGCTPIKVVHFTKESAIKKLQDSL